MTLLFHAILMTIALGAGVSSFLVLRRSARWLGKVRLTRRLQSQHAIGPLQAVASRLGLRIQDTDGAHTTFVDDQHGIELTVQYTLAGSQQGTHFAATGRGRIPRDIRIHRSHKGTHALRALPHNTKTKALPSKNPLQAWELSWLPLSDSYTSLALDFSDAHFAPGLQLLGPELEVFAIWSPAHRARLHTLIYHFDLKVELGEITLQEKGLLLEAEQLSVAVDRLRNVTRMLLLPQTAFPARLQHNVEEETHPYLRLRSLELLILNFPNAPETREACLFALEHLGPHEQLVAAMALKTNRSDLLSSLHATHFSPKAKEALLLYLETHTPEAERFAMLQELLEPTQPALTLPENLRDTALVMLGRLDTQEANAYLLAQLHDAKAQDRYEALPKLIALVRSIAQTTDSSFEPPLLGLFALQDEDLTAETVRALSSVGTPRAIATLYEEQQRARNKTHKELFEHAILVITERAGHAEIGGLSVLSSETQGSLTIAEHARTGELALAGQESESNT